MAFERKGEVTIHEGKIFTVGKVDIRFDDGEETEREIVKHPGAVAVVAFDGEKIFMVAQPREAVNEQALLELPAGKLDEEGESPEDTGKRELAEEIGKGAREWKKLTSFYTSPGFADEECHVYLATDLYDEQAEAEDNERIEIVEIPLARLDATIQDCRDAKSLVGLLWFKAYVQNSA
jgi:8-oxo-dGTP pyrophosphatase MutT (NUDIX family)